MEFSDLGKHCELCRQLDYLPIQCNLCKKFYCKLHSSYSNHNCIKFEKKKKKKKNNKSIYNYNCTYLNCKKKEIIKFECKFCRKNFCINHRLPELHYCLNLNNLNEKKENNFKKKKNNCYNCVIL